MSRYNLIDESWIPVRGKNGSYMELGIKEVLLSAKNLAEIEDPSPLVVASLYRFLLAVLYRALEGPTDIEEAKTLFKNGLPADKITSYLEKWRDRFWLFDEKYPFGQVAEFEPKIWRAWTVLAAENNADNAKVLFDHEDVTNASLLQYDKAAQGLLATQTFSVSCGKSELSHTGTAPSATAVLIMPIGHTLEDSFLLALVPQNREIVKSDLPIWERKPERIDSLKNEVSRKPCGLADRYTWRTRTIRLNDHGGGIQKVAFASGVKLEENDQKDPMLAYRIDEKHGCLPCFFSQKGLWRDFDSLLPDQNDLCPEVVNHAIELTKRNDMRFPVSILALGQANNKAKIEYWRMLRFALPRALQGNRSVRADIRRYLDEASEIQKALYSASRIFARNQLSRGDREPAASDVSAFLSQMQGTPLYWSILETQFHKLLQGYTLEKDPDQLEFLWLQAVRNALSDAWQQQRNTITANNAWNIRAMIQAEVPVRKKLAKLDAQLKEFQNTQSEESK